MTKAEALKIWLHEFGDVEYAHDFTGRKIKRDDYEVENQVGWVVSHVFPTAYEKANNYPEFEVVGVRYLICHDERDDFYYIEKIIED